MILCTVQPNTGGMLTSYTCTYHPGLYETGWWFDFSAGNWDLPSKGENRFKLFFSFLFSVASATPTFSKAPWLIVCVGNMRVASPEWTPASSTCSEIACEITCIHKERAVSHLSFSRELLHHLEPITVSWTKLYPKEDTDREKKPKGISQDFRDNRPEADARHISVLVSFILWLSKLWTW